MNGEQGVVARLFVRRRSMESPRLGRESDCADIEVRIEESELRHLKVENTRTVFA